jgi:hypothetical protein
MSSRKVVVVILSVVGGVLLLSCGACGVAGYFVWRSVDTVRQTARCKNNLRQIVLGIQNHHDQRGDLPPLYIADAQGRPLHSWRVLLLPYIEQHYLFEQIRLNEPWDSEHNRQFHSQMPSVYGCPSSPHPRESGLTSYFSISGEGAPLEPLTLESSDDQAIRRYGSPTSFASLSDGVSSQAMVFEATGYTVNWMEPVDVTFDELRISQSEDEKGFGSPNHGSIVQVAMGDGLVVALRPDTTIDELRAILTRNDGRGLEAVRFAQ